jgi:hypothetical protein
MATKKSGNATQQSETVYINNVSLKEKEIGDFTILQFSGNANEVIKQILQHTNEKGYFNFDICERKEVGTYGDTHYMKVNNFTPKK